MSSVGYVDALAWMIDQEGLEELKATPGVEYVIELDHEHHEEGFMICFSATEDTMHTLEEKAKDHKNGMFIDLERAQAIHLL